MFVVFTKTYQNDNLHSISKTDRAKFSLIIIIKKKKDIC